MKRGDIVTVATAGDYGKARPSVVVQSDWLTAESVLVALFASALVEATLFRLDVDPSDASGLNPPSQIMVDKLLAVPREKCGVVIGPLDDGAKLSLNQMLSLMLGLAD